MLTVAIPKRNKLQNIIVLTPKDGDPISLRYRSKAVSTSDCVNFSPPPSDLG